MTPPTEQRALELETFRNYASRREIGKYGLEALGDDAFVLHSPTRLALRNDRKIDLSFLALTHGNEVAGIAIVNEILLRIDSGTLNFDINIGFILGNVPAYSEGKRFQTTDLNRAFGRQETANDEQRRARFLEGVFRQCSFVVDFHQTQTPAANPFYISLFDLKSFLTFTKLMPGIDVVTYWEAAFSTQGMTTINYQVAHGGHGFGVELGTKGFDPKQIAFGVDLSSRMVIALSAKGFLASLDWQPDPNTNVYTWKEVLKTETGAFQLAPGFANMSNVTPGMRLGTIDGQEYVAKEEGRLLFPKYPIPGDTVAKGSEVCRILRRVSQNELKEKIREGSATSP